MNASDRVRLRIRLERLGLVEARSSSHWTVGAFIADYI